MGDYQGGPFGLFVTLLSCSAHTQVRCFPVAQQIPVVFADALMSVRLASGVIRITFGSLNDDNKLEPKVTLVVPLDQFNGIIRHLANAARDLIAKAREAQAKTVGKAKKSKPRFAALH